MSKYDKWDSIIFDALLENIDYNIKNNCWEDWKQLESKLENILEQMKECGLNEKDFINRLSKFGDAKEMINNKKWWWET